MIVAAGKVRRTAASATAIALLAGVVAACGGSQGPQAHRVRTVTPKLVRYSSRPPAVLAVAGLGTFEGRCPRRAHTWSLHFVPGEASELISYRLGNGPRHALEVNPGHAVTFHLTPGAVRTHESADRFVVPAGQPRGRRNATSVPTTAPLRAVIYQATEPKTLQADVRLALAAIGTDSGQCVLVGSTLHAYTYPN